MWFLIIINCLVFQGIIRKRKIQELTNKENHELQNPDTFLSIEIITIIAVASVMLVLIVFGIVYKTVILTRLRMNNSALNVNYVKQQNPNQTSKDLKNQISLDIVTSY